MFMVSAGLGMGISGFETESEGWGGRGVSEYECTACVESTFPLSVPPFQTSVPSAQIGMCHRA